MPCIPNIRHRQSCHGRPHPRQRGLFNPTLGRRLFSPIPGQRLYSPIPGRRFVNEPIVWPRCAKLVLPWLKLS